MSRAWSIFARCNYGKARVCEAWGVCRSTYYAREKSLSKGSKKRLGRPPLISDERLVEEISAVLDHAESLGFYGEGYRKVWARLRMKGVHTSKERVRRLMRDHGLQAPHRAGRKRGPKVHEGSIIPIAPNVMWGTDATQIYTRLEGTATIFVAVDHFAGDVVGIHATSRATRYEALEPIYQGIREHFGPLEKDVAKGLILRHDHGSQYMSHHFQDEIKFLGISSSPGFVKAPEGNGVAERFIRTLKEQLLWVKYFDTVEELRKALLDFKERYNHHWLMQRHGYLTPAQARAQYQFKEKAA